MPVYKIWSSDRRKRKAVVVTTLIELIETGKKKLDIEESESVTVVLEKDGTVIDDDEILAAFGGEVLCLLKSEEEWISDEMKTDKDSVEDNPTAPVQSEVTSPEHIPKPRENRGIIGETEVRNQERIFPTPELQTIQQLLEQYNLDTEYWGNVLEENGIVDIDHLVCINDDNSKQMMLGIRFDWEKDSLFSMLKECQTASNPVGDFANDEDSEPSKNNQCNQAKTKQNLLEELTHNSEIDLMRQYESDLLKLIKQLNLEEYYPQQIKLLDVQKISENASGAGLPWRILRRLMARDYRAIEEETQIYNENIKVKILTQEKTIGSSHSWRASSTDGLLNAMDVFLAVFHCCDLLLRQILFEVLFLCKLPFPLFTPMTNGEIEFSLWATRQVVINHFLNEQQVAESLAKVRCQRISFLRMGNSSRSKSQTLNKLFGGRDTFFHEDSTTGHIQRTMTNGLIEASIYIPSGKMSEPLSQVTMFLNLRGDGFYLSNHLELLGLLADTHVLFLPVQQLPETRTITQLRFLALKKTIVILTFDPKLSPTPTHQIDDWLDKVKRKLGSLYGNIIPVLSSQNGRDKNMKVLIDEILLYLNEQQPAKMISLEEVMQLIQHKLFISIDENNLACLQGKESAQEIIRQVEQHSTTECKSNILPIQGSQWKKWAKLQKESCGRQLSIDERNNREIEIQKIMQDISTRGSSRVLQQFIELLQDAEKEQYMKFFLQWMKLFLDEKSRLMLSEFRKQWLLAQQEFQKHASHGEGEETDRLRCSMNEKEQSYIEASLGIEHFLRELGLLYETSTQNQTLNDFACGLPALAAQLLLSGIPFELMDGDASYIPINWVRAVLKSLLEKIGDKKLFVLSVLGIQSSGKSTLLNTMFGLQFSVAAGRCTRGLFMQLLPVDKTSSHLPFDYICVIDTEGLRSIEIGDEHLHDNMLSTFVIGLADLTIINIKGENQSEIKDILEIVIHAFLKIHIANKDLNLRQQCIFIHQNVSDSGGSDNLCHSETKFLGELNKMTSAAADQEGVDYIDKFSHIIKFVGKTDYDRWYLSDCWCGDPPMAPANPGYSEKVCEARNVILNMALDDSKERLGMTFSNLFSLIEDLWSGVLSLDFMFCFRNSLELKAYSRMEERYTALIDDITDQANEWHICQRIALKKCDTYEELNNICHTKIFGLSRLLNESEQQAKTKLTNFFETNDMKQVTVQWKQHKLLSLKLARERIEQSISFKLNKFAELCRVNLFKKTQSNDHGQKIIQKAIDVAKSCKDMDDHQLREVFNDIWRKMLENVGDENSAEKQLDIVKCFESYIGKRFQNHLQLMKPGELAQALTIEEINGELEKYQLQRTDITPVGMLNMAMNALHLKDTVGKYEAHAKQETLQILDMLQRRIEINCQKQNDFEDLYVSELVTTIYKSLKTDREKTKQICFKFKNPYILQVTLLFSRYAVGRYQRFHDDFERENSIMAKLHRMREEAWNIFRETARESKVEVIAANILCDKLKLKLQDHILERLEDELTKQICLEFSKRKFHLITAVLEDLMQKGELICYLEYVDNPSCFAQKWLAEKMEARVFSNVGMYADTANILMKKSILQIIEIIKDASDDATADGSFDMEVFIRMFCKKTDNIAPFTEHDLCILREQTITRSENFLDLVNKNLTELEVELAAWFSAVTKDTVRWHDESPYEAAFNRLWGCKEHCPFCHEPCQDSDPDHWRAGTGTCHRTIQHKPSGLRGTHDIKNKLLVINPCTYAIITDRLFSCGVSSYKCRESGACTYTYRHHDHKDEEAHPYKEYKKFIPSWDIAPNEALDSCKYWMWVFYKFRHEIVNHYRWSEVKLPTIPASWNRITEKEALNSLREYH